MKTIMVSRDQIASVTLVVLLHGLIGYAWVPGYSASYICKCQQRLTLFDVSNDLDFAAAVPANRAARAKYVRPPLLISPLRMEDTLPAGALQRISSSQSAISFTVDADGRPRDCKVLPSSNDISADRSICRSVEGALRYQPARDANGKAVAAQIDWLPLTGRL